MYNILIVDGVSSKDLGFKVIIEDFDVFSTADSQSFVTEYGAFISRLYRRKTVVKEYKINIPNATLEKIDKFKSWLLKENVTFSDYPDGRFCTAYKINITSTRRMVSNLFSVTISVERSPFYYSKEEKVAGSQNGEIVINNSGEFKVFPKFEFVSSGDLTMLRISKSSLFFYQIGKENGAVIANRGENIKIDMETGVVLINGTRRIYCEPLSKRIDCEKGKTQLQISSAGVTSVDITARFREVSL